MFLTLEILTLDILLGIKNYNLEILTVFSYFNYILSPKYLIRRPAD